jgi:hypothetical protein
MARKKRGRKRRRPNAGSFVPGPDPRRHKFTKQDCRIGFWVCAIKHPELREWLRMKLFIYYGRSNNGTQTIEKGDACGNGESGHGADGDIPF